MTFNEGFILGLWRARNRPTDTPGQREQIRNTLRGCLSYERVKTGRPSKRRSADA